MQKLLLSTLVVLLSGGCDAQNAGNANETSSPAGATDAGSPKAVLRDDVVALTAANTKITFVGSKDDGQHRGGFNELTGSVELLLQVLRTAVFTVEIDTESLWSDNEKLTQHLKSPDFFEVKTYPKATLTTRGLRAGDGPGRYVLSANLALHGKARDIEIPVAMTLTDGDLTLKSDFTINRNDFGISYGPDKIHETVAISVAVGDVDAEVFQVATSAPADGGVRRSGFDPAERFDGIDDNGDGKLTREEMPEQFADRILQADTDGDGAVTKEEFVTGWRSRRARREGGGAPAASPAEGESN
jgi:polyisoprenoid-binding protein YceI